MRSRVSLSGRKPLARSRNDRHPGRPAGNSYGWLAQGETLRFEDQPTVIKSQSVALRQPSPLAHHDLQDAVIGIRRRSGHLDGQLIVGLPESQLALVT